MSWRHLKPLADYGKMSPAYIHLKDEDSLRAAIKGSDVVVNLIGKHYETKHYVPTIINASFNDVHVKGAEALARIAREEDVKHFVHLSSIAASPNSSSLWAKTKAEGEKLVAEQFPGAVIVKSNQIYGEEDRLLNNFAVQAKLFPRLPLIEGGNAKVNPIYVGDVARALAVIVGNWNETVGQTFYLQGDHTYTYKELAEYVVEQIHRPNTQFVDLPLQYAQILGRVVELLPNPVVTKDLFNLLMEDQVADPSQPGLAALGLTSAALESKAFNFLYKYRSGGHFVDPNAAHQ